MEDDDQHASRVVEFTLPAENDIIGIDNDTSMRWGDEQAERYLSFLNDVFQKLARNPRRGSPVIGRSAYRSFTARFSGRRTANKHRIYYREISNGIRIIRVLHTAMNWEDHMEFDDEE